MSNTTTTRPATTRTTAAPKVPTLRKLADGRLILTDLPFMVDGAGTDGAPGRSSRLMNSRGLGWAFEQLGDVKGWVKAASPGVAREVITTLADYGVTVVDATRKAAAPATVATPAPAEPRKPAARKAAPREASIMSGAQTVAHAAKSDLASAITVALVGAGVDAEIIAAAIAAATAKADEVAKIATVNVTTPAPVKAPRKAKGAAPVTVRKAAVKAPAAPSADLAKLTGAELAEMGTPDALAEITRRAERRAAKRAAKAN
jgi:hypothetical protein